MDRTTGETVTNRGFTRGFLIGGVLGATIALLYAPRSGQDLRAVIRSRGNEMADRMKRRADGVRRRARSAVEAFREERDPLKSRKKEALTG